MTTPEPLGPRGRRRDHRDDGSPFQGLIVGLILAAIVGVTVVGVWLVVTA